jgi:hypothetical protein
MISFVDLPVLGKPEDLNEFLPGVESLLPPSAYRDRETEDRIKERSPDSPLRFIRWLRFSDDLIFPIEQIPEAICFGEVFLYPDRIVPAPGFPPLLAEFFYRFVKPAGDRLGLKYYSTAFEAAPPQWAKRRGPSAIEIGIGWSVARQLLTDGTSAFRSALRPRAFRSTNIRRCIVCSRFTHHGKTETNHLNAVWPTNPWAAGLVGCKPGGLRLRYQPEVDASTQTGFWCQGSSI